RRAAQLPFRRGRRAHRRLPAAGSPAHRRSRRHRHRSGRRLGRTLAGAASVLELNPRLDSTAALACRLGYDFPRLAIEIAARTRPAPFKEPYPTGRHYHWLYGDLNAWRQGKIPLPVLVRSALRGYDLSLDWRDPAPGLHLLWRKL